MTQSVTAPGCVRDEQKGSWHSLSSLGVFSRQRCGCELRGHTVVGGWVPPLQGGPILAPAAPTTFG